MHDQPLYCRYCYSIPAAPVNIRGHRGMILVMKFLKAEGPFCRDCGTATFRRMTSQTFAFGWWGVISMFATPVTIVINLVTRSKLAKLPAPMPTQYSQYAPMDVGKPLMVRPLTLLGLLFPTFLLYSWGTMIVAALLH